MRTIDLPQVLFPVIAVATAAGLVLAPAASSEIAGTCATLFLAIMLWENVRRWTRRDAICTEAVFMAVSARILTPSDGAAILSGDVPTSKVLHLLTKTGARKAIEAEQARAVASGEVTQ